MSYLSGPTIAQHVARRHPVPTMRAPFCSCLPAPSQQLDGLGFSLKPPKAIRKAATAIKKAVTIKNVAKVAAIGAGAALAVVAAPIVAPIIGTVIGGGAKIIGGLLPKVVPAAPSVAPSPGLVQQLEQAAVNTILPVTRPLAPTIAPLPALEPVAAPAAVTPAQYAAQSAPMPPPGTSYGPETQSEAAAAPAAGGAGNMIAPIAIGVVALVLLGGMGRKGR